MQLDKSESLQKNTDLEQVISPKGVKSNPSEINDISNHRIHRTQSEMNIFPRVQTLAIL